MTLMDSRQDANLLQVEKENSFKTSYLSFSPFLFFYLSLLDSSGALDADEFLAYPTSIALRKPSSAADIVARHVHMPRHN